MTGITSPLCVLRFSVTWVVVLAAVRPRLVCRAGEILVKNLTSSATTNTSTQPGRYETFINPVNWPSYPNGPPEADNNLLNLVQHWTYTPPPILTPGPATTIPLEFRFVGSDGSTNTVTAQVPNPSVSAPLDTFRDFGFLVATFELHSLFKSSNY